MATTDALKSALFVDLDNILIGLRKLDAAAAEAFGKDPSSWVDWLARGEDQGGLLRRFLVKYVYLNPATFSMYRAFFTRNGFRVMDCPSLTSQGKNSADIYMVIDILDALNGPERYDEFVIASGDADFAPVLHRLRSRDRFTTVLTAGLSAASYRAVCDRVIPAEQLVAVLLGEDADNQDIDYSPSLDVPPSSAVVSAAAQMATESASGAISRISEAIVAAVRASGRPLVSAAAAHAALVVDKDLKSSDWRGAGSFRAFLALYVPAVTYASYPSPGYVYDPTVHSPDDLPAGAERADLTEIQRQVSRVTDAPAMDSDRYLAVYRALSEDLATESFNITRTSKNVRDRTAQLGQAVGRNAINFIIRGLVAQGVGLSEATTVQVMAAATANNVIALCTSFQLELTPEHEQLIRNWVNPGGSGVSVVASPNVNPAVSPAPPKPTGLPDLVLELTPQPADVLG